ncbi:MAG: hypothetical protein KC503_36210 [Myxococcales bacterium]|nr:hypothetical protein [Myxococcales bacterium]
MLCVSQSAHAQYAPPPPPGEDPYTPGPPPLPMVLTSAHLRVGAIIPFGKGYADSTGGGLALDAAVWIETPYIVIEPRIGVRFDLARGRNAYAEVPIDVGAFYMFGRGSALVFIGGGIGARHHWETRGETVTVGNILQTTTERDSDDRGWGFGAYGRIGFAFGRRRGLRGRFTISAEINTTIIEINGVRNPTAVVIAAGGLY